MKLKEENVQWVVNNLGELGVKIGNQLFFLYKGHSLCYQDTEAGGEGVSGMTYRPVGKREFGECCHPINREDYSKIGTVSPDDSDEWQPIPSSK